MKEVSIDSKIYYNHNKWVPMEPHSMRGLTRPWPDFIEQ